MPRPSRFRVNGHMIGASEMPRTRTLPRIAQRRTRPTSVYLQAQGQEWIGQGDKGGRGGFTHDRRQPSNACVRQSTANNAVAHRAENQVSPGRIAIATGKKEGTEVLGKIIIGDNQDLVPTGPLEDSLRAEIAIVPALGVLPAGPRASKAA